MNTPLHKITEDTLITEISKSLRKKPADVVGIGDDCAVLPDNKLLKTDCVIENRHYTSDTTAELVGRKAIARVMSDLAAMGGHPEYFLITCGLRATTSINYVRELYKGMDAICEEYGGHIVGGETCSIPDTSPQFFSITGYGKAVSPILRSGAKIGDHIYVTGELGNSLNTQHHLHFTPRIKESLWLIDNTLPSSMMDLSDGLARDLPRLTKASKVGYSIFKDLLPLRNGATADSALNDGEDYELLFTVTPEKSAIVKKAPFPITCIGEITDTTTHPLDGGWDHLRESVRI